MVFTTDTSDFKGETGNVNIFQAIIKHTESMFRLHVITNVGLFMLLLLHQEEHMTLQH